MEILCQAVLEWASIERAQLLLSLSHLLVRLQGVGGQTEHKQRDAVAWFGDAILALGEVSLAPALKLHHQPIPLTLLIVQKGWRL